MMGRINLPLVTISDWKKQMKFFLLNTQSSFMKCTLASSSPGLQDHYLKPLAEIFLTLTATMEYIQFGGIC